MTMRVVIALCAMLTLVGSAFADTYHNDCSSLTDWYEIDANMSDVYLSDGGTAVSSDIAAGFSGYAVLRLGDHTSGGVWTGTGLTQCSTGTPLDVTGNMMWVRARDTFTGAEPPSPPPTLTIWARMFSGDWDGTKWIGKCRAAWSMTLTQDGTWYDSGWFPLWNPQAKDYQNGGTAWEPSKVFAMRFDLVYWDANYSPNQYSIDDVLITAPEPGAMAALGLGLVGLVPFIRRRK
jgi:hypothetical protein